MALCALLKGDLLSWSSELLANYEVLLNIWVRNFRNKLIILLYQIIELFIDIRIILKLIYPTTLLLPWRISFLIIIFINLMPMLTGRRKGRMVNNGYFDILQK